MDCFVATAPRNDGGWLERRSLALTALHCSDVFRLPNRQCGGSIPTPTQSRAELQLRRRQWDMTSEVPQVIKNWVHGALHWWALSKAVRPHFLKPYWRALAPSRAPAASMPEPRSA